MCIIREEKSKVSWVRACELNSSRINVHYLGKLLREDEAGLQIGRLTLAWQLCIHPPPNLTLPLAQEPGWQEFLCGAHEQPGKAQ